MPELPEVETIRRQLEPRLVRRRIVDAAAHWSPKFSAATDAVGASFLSLDRRGKYLIAGLDTERELIVHLGMTGSLRVDPCLDDAGVEPAGTPDPHERARWILDDASALVFRDVRRFGRIAVVERGDHSALPTLAALGPEPFSDAFTPESLRRAARSSRRALKTLLLNQRVVAGVGNIYADEALWSAGVHPATRTLSRVQAGALHAALLDVLRAGLDNGGTTLRDYVDGEGNRGENQRTLRCYGRAGLPCLRCGATLCRNVIDARTSTWCSACQRR